MAATAATTTVTTTTATFTGSTNISGLTALAKNRPKIDRNQPSSLNLQNHLRKLLLPICNGNEKINTKLDQANLWRNK